MSIVDPQVFKFLKQLKENNTRDWMNANKKEYLAHEKALKSLYNEITIDLNKTDVIEKLKVFRINRDIRFSKNKTPYNSHRSVSWSRSGAERRGGYYLRLEPGNSYLAGGFFSPEKDDLLRIRKEFQFDEKPIEEILNDKNFKAAFGNFNQDNKVKTAPKGFDKEHKNIELIRLKSFFVQHHFTDEEVVSKDFKVKVISYFELLRPYFDYMSEVLATDLNGESIL